MMNVFIYTNEEWRTLRIDNIHHAVEEHLHWQFVGENHPNSKYTNEFVLYIYKLLQDRLSTTEIENIVRKKYKEYANIDHKQLISFIGRIRRKDRYGKILDNKGSTTIVRNID